MAKIVPDPAADATPLEKADVAVAQAAAPYQDTPAVKALGLVGELGDQPPLIALSVATLGWGLVARDRRLARAGARMLAAHLLATAVKNAIKTRVDRTRPFVLAEEGCYEMKPGRKRGKESTSFPSGHTAGAVAVARAVAREFPERKAAAYGAAATIAAIQIPRCAHYPTDIGAGALIGLMAEAAVDVAARRLA